MTTGWRLPLYAVLDVEQDADAEAIQRAYRETVKEYHPDVADHEDAQDLFVWATRAKSVLTDEAERRRYDRLGHVRFCEQEGWTSSTCSAKETAETYWGPLDDEGGPGENDTGPRDGGEDPHDSDSRDHCGGSSGSQTAPSGSKRRRGTVEQTAGSGPRTEPGRATARAAGAGTGSTHPAAFGGDNLYYRNIVHVHATHRRKSGSEGIQWAPFVAIGVTLSVLFGSFALVMLYLG
jgi:curved DNA-binding protein CbpA